MLNAVFQRGISQDLQKAWIWYFVQEVSGIRSLMWNNHQQIIGSGPAGKESEGGNPCSLQQFLLERKLAACKLGVQLANYVIVCVAQ